MIQVICEDGEFKVKGSIALGITGVHKNDTFEDDMLSIDDCSYEDICNALEAGEDFFLNPLLPYFEKVEKSEEGFASALESYYNEHLTEMQKYIKEINDCIWIHLFENLVGCAYPFWEIEQAILPEYAENYEEDDYMELYDKHGERIYEMFDAFYEQPNNGTVDKPDVLTELRRMFPMFNFDGLIKTIEPEGIVLKGRYMAFQFSDAWGCDLFCSAYDDMDENFTFTDWHNH
ncbi:MAG: hypothetical protein IJF07_02830 [Lachnospiraceae bacterium]|nr:hypothetical protein [Lachnospiraceae bacterium]